LLPSLRYQVILKKEDAIVFEIAAQAFPAFLCDHLCGKVQTTPETDRLTSQIGNAIALAHPEWQFAWIVSADGMGNSLRPPMALTFLK
jgi:hypothetical protein